ncbi:MAG TPA: methyltransferase [Anaerolineae bacterium]|nr:methyltransferase [Anaerolineae bacterium]
MKDWRSSLNSLHPHLLAWIWSLLLLLQMVLTFFVFHEPRLPGLGVVGWAIWVLGTLFAILPIFTLRVRGGVPDGKSYMETTALVDSGIYAIVRHPQSGTAGILLNLALALIGQHGLLVVLAAVGMVLLYIDTFRADDACIEKFGEEYVRYMQRVPRVNFVAGILRLFMHRRPEGTSV